MFALDANALIHALKGKGQVRRAIEATRPADLSVPAVVAYELEVGTLRSGNPAARRRELNRLLTVLTVLPFDLEAADRAAHERGLEIGREARRRAGKEAIDAALVRKLTDVLRENGFEPMRKGNELRLRNCPFDALANDYRDLVCGMNLAMQRGVLEGLRARKINAVFEPVPGACCVAFKIGLASRRARSLSAS